MEPSTVGCKSGLVRSWDAVFRTRTKLAVQDALVPSFGWYCFGCRSDIYNGVNNLQAHYRWYVTDCF